MSEIRSPIVSVLGHVDHGKSSILDAVRGTDVLSGEAGGITQAIGASIIPIDVIKEMCGSLLENLDTDFTIPGLLFIDTPGHSAFNTLRKRGGSLADIAVLVVDINEGLQPQTLESIDILKNTETPFVIAANKIDAVPGYRKRKNNSIEDIELQRDKVKERINIKIYEIVGDLYEEFGINAERFDKVDNYTKKVGVVPCSATEKIGISELLMTISGMAQKYLEKNLEIKPTGAAKGTILEVKETKGHGTTADTIIYDGVLKKNDLVVVGTTRKPKVCKVRALMEPAPLSEMRDKRSDFRQVEEVKAATGVKIASPDFDHTLVAGMPLRKTSEEEKEKVLEEVKTELEESSLETSDKGVIIKADSIGSLEALHRLLKEKEIDVKRASVGEVTKKDIAEAESSYEKNPLESAILAFNVEGVKSTEKVKVITHSVIYQLIEDYEEWVERKKKEKEAEELSRVPKPAKLEVLQGCVFRQSSPCVLGVEVLKGELHSGTSLMQEDGSRVSHAKSIEQEEESLSKAGKGLRVAVSLPGVTAGRQVEEGDILFTDIKEEEFRKLKELKRLLSSEEIDVLKRVAEIKRKSDSLWGI